jgi:hypothetical protein
MKCRKKVRNAYLRRYKMLVRRVKPYKLDRKMQIIQHLIDQVNTVLWSYVLIVLLIGYAIFFTIRTRFVQFRMIGEQDRLR